MVITQQPCLGSSMVIIQQQQAHLLLLEVLTERLIEVMLLASMNPLATVQITQSSMVGAEVVVVVLSTVVNTLVVVLITLVAGDSKVCFEERSVTLSGRLISPDVSVPCLAVLDAE